MKMTKPDIKIVFDVIHGYANDEKTFQQLYELAGKDSNLSDHDAASILQSLVDGNSGAETPGVVMFLLGTYWRSFVTAVESDLKYKADEHKTRFKALGDDPKNAEARIRQTVEKFAGVKCAKTKIAKELGISAKTLNRYLSKIPDCEIK